MQKWPVVQRPGNKKSTMSLQMRSCQTHKRCAIFRLMAINTSHELQHSSNLYFHESLLAPPPVLAENSPFTYVPFGTCSIAWWFSIVAATAVLCATKHSRGIIELLVVWLSREGSPLLAGKQLCPPVRASKPHTLLHCDPPLTQVVIWLWWRLV